MKDTDHDSFPRVVKPASISLTDLETSLLQKVFPDYAEVILEKEFTGGFSGTRVFLALPVRSNGARDARLVVKIGPADELRHEFENYQNYAGRALPFTAAQVREPYEQDGWAALNYVFVGDADLGKSLSLEDYYHAHAVEEVTRTLENLFGKALGPMWYRQSLPLTCRFRDEYGRHLPPHQELEGIVRKIMPGAVPADGSRVIIPGVSDTFPNPLAVYPNLLDTILQGRRSIVHGDLHLRNILVDESGKAWLIDFAKVSQRHNLFDFIKLEVYIRLMTLAKEHGAFSLNEYVQFEQALNDTALNRAAEIPSNPKLNFAFKVILAIRALAGNYLADRHAFRQEYLSALFLYALAVMKYHPSNGDVPTRLLFVTACVLGQCLSEADLTSTAANAAHQDLVADGSRERILDAALPKRIALHKAAQLLTLIRQTNSKGLRAIIEVETGLQVTDKDVIHSQPFELEFPLDKNGKPGAIPLALELDAGDFTPPHQRQLVLVPITGDSQLCTFQISPNVIGELMLTLRVLHGDLCITSRPLKTSSQPLDFINPEYELTSVPIHVTVINVAGDATISTGAGSTALDQGVKIGGDAKDAVIITGNDNTVRGSTRSIDTGGGAYVEGNVNVRGGDFVGRDQYNVVLPAKDMTIGSAPPRPPLVIGREEAMHDLKVRLGISAAATGRLSASFQVLTAMRGWPGVGKTTLAATLAHDPDLAKAFPDGVLWISLGPDMTSDKILSFLASWGRALGTNELLRAHSVEEASAQLAALLRDKKYLLIVDDVWETAHARPFCVGGRGCVHLITTRESSVAQALAPTPDAIYNLLVLSEEKSLELLSILAPTVVAQHPDPVRELVRELEGLPLALQVAGRLLDTEAEYGFSVLELLDELRAGAKLLEARAPVDRTDLATQTTPTIAALLEKSTERLSEHVRDCFALLGVFAPKPATFDLEAIQAVWKVIGQEDPKPVVKQLIDRGLLEYIPSLNRYQMHALLVLHAKSLITED